MSSKKVTIVYVSKSINLLFMLEESPLAYITSTHLTVWVPGMQCFLIFQQDAGHNRLIDGVMNMFIHFEEECNKIISISTHIHSLDNLFLLSSDHMVN